MVDTVKDLDAWRAAALEQWTDGRIAAAEWVDAWVWLWLHSYADLVKIGAELRGATFRQKGGDWLLVVKVVCDDTPQVGFVSSSDPTGCVKKFRRLLRSGEFTLVADRYA